MSLLRNWTSTKQKAWDHLYIHQVQKNQRQRTRKGPQLLKILSLNCNSIKRNEKNCEFRALIEQHAPHVATGCESKIDNSFSTYSLFPDCYSEVYRKDRTKDGGVVFCAIREDVLACEEKDFLKDNECVWGSVQFAITQKLYLSSFYRPPRAPLEQLEQLEQSLTDIHTRQGTSTLQTSHGILEQSLATPIPSTPGN